MKRSPADVETWYIYCERINVNDNMFVDKAFTFQKKRLSHKILLLECMKHNRLNIVSYYGTQ